MRCGVCDVGCAVAWRPAPKPETSRTIEEIRESSRRVESPPSNIDASLASSSSSRLSACVEGVGLREVAVVEVEVVAVGW